MAQVQMNNNKNYCGNCQFSTVSHNKMFCLKNHFNRTYVYKTCEKYEKPEQVFKEVVAVWKYFGMV